MSAAALARQYHSATVFVPASIACAFLFAAVYALTFFDARLLNGVSVWDKPAKFFLSLCLHMATLAWGLTLLPEAARRSAAIRGASGVFLAAALFEMVYIVFRASRGEASHFNTATPTAAALYSLMGAGAVTLCAVTAFIGWRILRAGRSPMHLAAGAGFLASSVLTVAIAGYLGSNAGHWVGGDRTDATGLPFFHWSTTGGDLRVPHFASLHLMQAVPLAAWLWPDRRLILAALAAGVALTFALFAQALTGLPFLSV